MWSSHLPILSITSNEPERKREGERVEPKKMEMPCRVISVVQRLHSELSLTMTRGSGSSGGHTSPVTSCSSFSSSTATALKCQTVHTCLVLLVSTPGQIVQKSLSNPFLNLLILPVSANPYSSKLQNFPACHVETFLLYQFWIPSSIMTCLANNSVFTLATILIIFSFLF